MRRLGRYGCTDLAFCSPSTGGCGFLHILQAAPAMHMQAALDAMEAYYVKVKTEQRQLRERLDEVEATNQTLQTQLQTLTREHSQCTNSK